MGHGAAALVNVTVNGHPLLAGKIVRTHTLCMSPVCSKHGSPHRTVSAAIRLPRNAVSGIRKNAVHAQATAFSNSEEDATGRSTLVPFLLEDRIKEVCCFSASVPE